MPKDKIEEITEKLIRVPPEMTRDEACRLLAEQADHVLQYMVDKGLPLNRRTYFDVGWIAGDWRHELDAELESELPEPFQLAHNGG